MIENLRFASLGLRDQRLVQHIKDILAYTLEFGLDLLAIVANGANVLLGTLGLLLLLDGRDDSPRRTSSPDHVLVSNRKEISLIDCELATDLGFD